MPRKPKGPCGYPGCSRITHGQYCEEHRKIVDRKYNKYSRTPDAHKKYGRVWKRIHDRYAQSHPFCEMCFTEGRMTMMEEVHHIISVSRGGTHDRSNLISLRRSCHNKIHHELADR